MKEQKSLRQGSLVIHLRSCSLMQVEHALRNGSDVVLRIDVQGAETIRKLLPHSVHIFLVGSDKQFCE